ncbi:hypothetical protein M5K25_000470 [Dendrobium thyrsiflorum]|uniref:Uncharacterized protein n=1 Tax=Dendrobium thyrsiflorum TaxID=117978 RepID=A0ABD0WBB8_DENTH
MDLAQLSGATVAAMRPVESQPLAIRGTYPEVCMRRHMESELVSSSRVLMSKRSRSPERRSDLALSKKGKGIAKPSKEEVLIIDSPTQEGERATMALGKESVEGNGIAKGSGGYSLSGDVEESTDEYSSI